MGKRYTNRYHGSATIVTGFPLIPYLVVYDQNFRSFISAELDLIQTCPKPQPGNDRKQESSMHSTSRGQGAAFSLLGFSW